MNQAGTRTMENRIEPGAIEIDSCIIISSKAGSVDVKNTLLSLTLYEDIMSPFISGKIMLTDGSSVNTVLPLLGEELLYLEMRTPGFESEEYVRRGMFLLYKMETRENFMLKNTGYTLCFTSVEAATDLNQQISATFRGRISNTVQKLINDAPGLSSLKNAVVETTSNSEIHTSNFWTPTQNIYYLSSKALNDLNNPSYVFFENSEGFVFASLDALASIPATYTFIRDSKMRTVKPTGTNSLETQNSEEEYQKILDISIPSMYDYMARVQQGFYGSSIYHYDLETKRLNYRNFVAAEQLKKVKLNPYPMIGENLQFIPNASMFLSIINKNLYNGAPNVAVDHHSKRVALLSEMYAMKINIRTFGRLNYSVGNVVDFTAYKEESTSKKTPADDDIDEMLSGKYLITALSHEITRDNHYCNLELAKDSVIKDLTKNPDISNVSQ